MKIENSEVDKINVNERSKLRKQRNAIEETFANFEKSTSEDLNVITKKDSEKSSSEKQNESYVKISKTKEYYENGNPKSELEVSENMNKEIYKLNYELDNLKNKTQVSKKEIEKLTATNKHLLNFTESLKIKINTQDERSQKLTIENNNLKKEKSSKAESDRPVWWLYALLYFAGIATIPLIKLFVNNRINLKE